MSGDVQPRKRKDKRRKRDAFDRKSEGELSFSRQISFQDDDESSHGVHSTKMGSDDVHLHVQHDHGTGGHWCAKIIFFSLMTVLLGLVALIIIENRGLADLDTPLSESRFSNYFEGWVEENRDDHGDPAHVASEEPFEEEDEEEDEDEDHFELEKADQEADEVDEHDEDDVAETDEDDDVEDDEKNLISNDDDEDIPDNEDNNLTVEETVEVNDDDDDDENDDDDDGDQPIDNDNNDNDDEIDNHEEEQKNNGGEVDDDDDDDDNIDLKNDEINRRALNNDNNAEHVNDDEKFSEVTAQSKPNIASHNGNDDDDDDIFDEDDDEEDTFENVVENDAEELLILQQKAAEAGRNNQPVINEQSNNDDDDDDDNDANVVNTESSWAASLAVKIGVGVALALVARLVLIRKNTNSTEEPARELLMKRRLTIASDEEQIPDDDEDPPLLEDDYSEEEVEIEEEIEIEDDYDMEIDKNNDVIAMSSNYVPETFEQLQSVYKSKDGKAATIKELNESDRKPAPLFNKSPPSQPPLVVSAKYVEVNIPATETSATTLEDSRAAATSVHGVGTPAYSEEPIDRNSKELETTPPLYDDSKRLYDENDDNIDYDDDDVDGDEPDDASTDESYDLDDLDEGDISDVDDTELMNRLDAKYGSLPAKEYESDQDPDDPAWTLNY